MDSPTMELLKKRARVNPQTIILPEGEAKSIIQAAEIAGKEGICHPVLLGDREKILNTAKELSVDASAFSIRPLPDEKEIDRLCKIYEEEDGLFPSDYMALQFMKPLFYAAMLVHLGEADSMVAGLEYSTSDVIVAARTLVGMKDGIDTPSSIFLMEVPNFEGSEGNAMVISDRGVCIDPTEQKLADIAITTAGTVQALLDWEPRIAMLSFSTMGSADSILAKKMSNATARTKERAPELLVDGEMQLDAAIVPEVAAKKCPSESPVAGKANILIFPDLNAGNIAYKAVQRFTGGNAYGPFLQGFRKTVSDLSRGSGVEDIIGVITMASVCAANQSN